MSRASNLKGALNPNFLNLTMSIEKDFGFRNVLVPFLNLLLLKSCTRTSHPFQNPLRKQSHRSVLNQILQLDYW